jgi:hypothetical protein
MPLNIDESHPSPNQSSRGGATVRAIVMHATAGTNSLPILTDPAPGGHPERRVSAHYLIAKNGTIYRLVPDNRVAFHAGVAAIPPLGNDVNAFSIGIEMENLNNGMDPYPKAQMDATVELVQDLVKKYAIPRQFVVTHRAIALPRGRKSDPQPPAFNMEQFLDRVFDTDPGHAVFVVTDDGLRVREGAGTDFQIVALLNRGDEITVDRIVEGEDIDGEQRWAHLADGRGFATMRFLRAK